MSELDEVLRNLDEVEQKPHDALVRLYLVSNPRPPVADLGHLLAEYEVFVPRSQDDLAFIRKVALESEEQFRAECQRVAGILAPLVPKGSHLGCRYDDVKGKTSFQFELQKTGESREFLVTDQQSH
jgi:hypothetical protein